MNKLLDSSLTRGFSRRSFLVGLGATAALPILAACQPQVVEKTVEVPVIVKETVVVQEVVEKEVIEIEKEVIVEGRERGHSDGWASYGEGADHPSTPHGYFSNEAPHRTLYLDR